MGLVVDGHQVGEGDLCVFLGGGQARVAEQFLDRAEVGAVGEQMGRIRMAEAVRVHRRVAVDVYRVELDDESDAARRETAVPMVQKNGRFIADH